LQCGDNRLANGSVVSIDCPPAAARALGNVYLGRLGTVPACQDAGTGLLINCWNTAVAKGLAGLNQEQLTQVATAYQRLTRPNRLAGLGGWQRKKGGGVQWVRTTLGRLGQPDIIASDLIPPDVLASGSWSGGSSTVTTDAQGNVIPTPAWVVPNDLPPNPIGIVTQPAPPPRILANIQPTLPYVTAQTLLAAAQLPNAPAVVKQAAAQLPASTVSASSLGSFFSGSAIAGIPNYFLLAAGLFFVLAIGAGARRR
jgi:hypothetical protein